MTFSAVVVFWLLKSAYDHVGWVFYVIGRTRTGPNYYVLRGSGSNSCTVTPCMAVSCFSRALIIILCSLKVRRYYVVDWGQWHDEVNWTVHNNKISLNGDDRSYWLDCFKESLPKFTERAIASQAQAPDVHERAGRCVVMTCTKRRTGQEQKHRTGT